MNRVFPVLMLALGLVVGSSITIAYAAGTIELLGDVLVNGALTIQDGTEGLGKVFTSDSGGTGSWQNNPSDDTYTNEITKPLTGNIDFVEVFCDAGDKALGGGGSQSSAFANLIASHPIDGVTPQVAAGWNASFANQVGFSPLITGYVVCMNTTP